MKRHLIGLMVVGSCVFSSPAWALFNVQVLGGQRNSKFDPSTGPGDTISGSELRASAHIDPIPLVPIGFGISAAQTTFDDESTKLGVNKVDGQDIDLEVEAWLPLELAGLVPYAKLGYTVGGEYEVTPINAAWAKGKYTPSGATIKAGLKYEFLMRLGVMLEVETGTRKLKADTNGYQDIDQNSTSFLIGAQAGL